jgi:hypothetical protein
MSFSACLSLYLVRNISYRPLHFHSYPSLYLSLGPLARSLVPSLFVFIFERIFQLFALFVESRRKLRSFEDSNIGLSGRKAL